MPRLPRGRRTHHFTLVPDTAQTWTAGSGAAPSQATSGFYPGIISRPVRSQPWRTEMQVEGCPPLGPLGVRHLTAPLASPSPSRHHWKSVAKFQPGGKSPCVRDGLLPPARCRHRTSEGLNRVGLGWELSSPVTECSPPAIEARAGTSCQSANDKAAPFRPRVFCVEQPGQLVLGKGLALGSPGGRRCLLPRSSLLPAVC